jgi:hypothetical protein
MRISTSFTQGIGGSGGPSPFSAGKPVVPGSIAAGAFELLAVSQNVNTGNGGNGIARANLSGGQAGGAGSSGYLLIWEFA